MLDFYQKNPEFVIPETRFNEIKNFVESGLNDFSISRLKEKMPWGVDVPGDPDQVMYVWFDAPIGYISSTMEWAEKIGEPDKWKDYWFDKETRLVHFIGKDNIPFHAIIWPSVLMGQNSPFILPYDIPANEYLNLEGEKFSTSLNWAVWVDEYLEVFPADPLRYFLASNAPENKDADFSWKAFQTRNNEELANILGNFANRTLTFINNFCRGIVPNGVYTNEDKAIFIQIEDKVKEIRKSFSTYKVRDASKLVMDIARTGNKYFDEMKPWALKNDQVRLDTVMNVCMNLIRVLTFSMYPIIPSSANKLWEMIGEEHPLTEERWDTTASKRIKHGQKIKNVSILFTKYDDQLIQEQLDKLVKKSQVCRDNSQKAGVKMEEVKKEEIKKTEEIKAVNPPVTIEDFKKLDLRVAEIISAVPIEKSKKLLKLKVKVGDVEKQILAGISSYFTPESLIGKKVVIINNLEPAKLMGEISEGMLLAAGTDDKTQLAFLTPSSDMPSGSRIS